MDRLSRSRKARAMCATTTPDCYSICCWSHCQSLVSQTRQTAAPPSNYIAECASCHAPSSADAACCIVVAIVNTLNRHYGVDASVDRAARRELTRWLTDNAVQRAQTARRSFDARRRLYSQSTAKCQRRRGQSRRQVAGELCGLPW